MAPPYTPPPSTATARSTLLKLLFEAAKADDVSLFKGLVTLIDNDRGRHKEAIEELRWAGLDGLNNLGVLHAASSKGSLEVCKYLIEDLKFNANDLDQQGRTPLHLAVLCGCISTANYLLMQGADPNEVTSEGLRPLHVAALSGNSEAAQLLIANDANIDEASAHGTPLHCAAVKDHARTVELLLSHRADCNKMLNGKTPLTAAREADSRISMVLLSREEASEEVCEGSDRTKKRLFKDGIQDSIGLDSENFFNQCYGDCPEELFQYQRRLKRRRDEIAELRAGGRVMLQGFAQSVSKRNKKLALVVLRNGPHTVKCIISTDMFGVSEDMISYAGKLSRESYIEVHGDVRINTDNKPELDVRKIYCIARAFHQLPFSLEDATRPANMTHDKNHKKFTHVALNTRLDKRFFDLRTNTTRSIFLIQSAVTIKFTEVMASRDFVMIHSPKLTSKASSEGGAAVFELLYTNGKPATLAQSPQLYKQMAINGGFRKVFEIAPVYRAEKSKTHRHLCEYVGLHAEMEICNDYMEVCDLVGSLFVRIFDHLKENYQEEMDFIKEQYPFVNLQYLPNTLKLKYIEGIGMLKDAGFKIEEFDDLNDAAEKKTWGVGL